MVRKNPSFRPNVNFLRFSNSMFISGVGQEMVLEQPNNNVVIHWVVREVIALFPNSGSD